MLKKTRKTKKSSKKAAKVVKKVEMSGEGHLEGLVKAAKGYPGHVYDIFSAVRGPDEATDVKFCVYKEKYTGVIRTWIFGANQCGGMMQSKTAPVTESGWEVLREEVLGEIGIEADNGRVDHFLEHIQSACYAIKCLYANGVFKEGK
jgi:hypothetical protein